MWQAMKWGVLVAICAMTMGCGEKPKHDAPLTQAEVVDAQPLAMNTTSGLPSRWSSDAQEIDLLRTEAKARHLHFTVHCFGEPTGSNIDYIGRAWPENADRNNAIYIEDGAVPEWFVHSSTQRGAVQLLLDAIKGPVNSYPSHRPSPEQKKKHECPPEIQGY